MIGTILEGEEFRCALCRGKGVLSSRKTRCPACSGRSFVRLSPPVTICAYCNGQGEVPARSNIVCTVCSGKGVVTIQQPVEVCPQCRRTGAAPHSKLPCLACRGKGVVTVREDEEAATKARSDDWNWVAVAARRAMAEVAKKGHDERPEIQDQPSPVCLQVVPSPVHGHEAGQEREAGCVCQPQQSRDTKMVRAGAVSGLVRRLMAAERARMLGGKPVNIGRYTLEKRAQRWRESRSLFK